MRDRWIVAAALAAGIAVPGRIGRADEGPIIIAHRDEHPWLTLDPFKGSIALNGIYEVDHSQTPGGGGSASESDALFSQELSLSSGGAIVSKNLLEWSASGTAAVQEEYASGIDGRASSIGFFDAYDANVNLLSTTQFPISAYAQRSESLVNRSFAGLLRDEVTDYGATFQYRSPVLPSTLDISHTTTTETDLVGNQQFNIDQSNLDFGTSFAPWDRHNVSVNYAYSVINQNNPGQLTNGSETETLSAAHHWGIDPQGRYVLSQMFNYSQESGTFSETRLRLDEQLRARLAENLDGDAAYTLDREEYATSLVTNQMVSAGLTHRLYQSLTTSGRVGASLSDNSYTGTAGETSSSARTVFANVGTSYTKKVYLGRLGANLSLGWNESDDGAVGQTQQVLGDVETFNDPQPIILTRTGVNGTTVAVFNASGTRRYVPGVDYTVRSVANTVEIDRVVGGNINAGDTVRLNYDINPLPGYTSQTVSLGAGTNYAFDEGPLKGLNLFVRYDQADQSISPASAQVLPDSIKDTTFGAEYRVWKLTLRAEDEMRESTLAPYDALRLTASYADNLGERTTLSLDASQTYLSEPTDHSRTVSTAVDGRLQYEIARDLHAMITAAWRNDVNSPGGNTTGLEGQGELRWRVRQTNFSFLVRYTSLKAPETDQNTFVFQFGISRSF